MNTIIREDQIGLGDLPKRKPEWLRVKMPTGESYNHLKRLMRTKNLHTVCEEAMCPNLGECWSKGTSAPEAAVSVTSKPAAPPGLTIRSRSGWPTPSPEWS